MANRFPLIVNAADSKVYELASGDNLDLTGSNIANSTAVITLPTVTSTLATLAGTETFTNKTLTSPTVNTSVIAGSATMALYNTTATNISFAGAATTLSIGASTGTTTINNNAVITGNLTVNGTTTTVNSTTLTVDDILIELGSVATPTDTTANGGGVKLYGTTNKTFAWYSSTGAWTSSEHISLAAGKTLIVNGSSSGATTITAAAAASGTLTLPAATDTLVGKATTDTLTNKTINLANNTLTATSAQIAAAVSDETGTGSLVFSASPALTGTPTAPTATQGNNSTQIATTAYVDAAMTNAIGSALALAIALG